MPKESGETVGFDVLVRSPASGRSPTVASIREFRPDPKEIERCRRWFASRGVEAHPTEFGLACRAPRKLFESLFRVSLKPLGRGPGRPPFEILGRPVPPGEIAEAIEQVTIAAGPELF